MSTGYKKLCRSNADIMFNGVCGGLGEFLNIDPTLIRLIAVALAFATGPIIALVYLILAVVIPKNPEHVAEAALTQISDFTAQ